VLTKVVFGPRGAAIVAAVTRYMHKGVARGWVEGSGVTGCLLLRSTGKLQNMSPEPLPPLSLS